MSSKIVRRQSSSAEEPQPMQWRDYGKPAGARPTSGAVANPASAAAGDSTEVKQLCAAAYQQGHAAGEAAGAQRAQAKFDPAIASFTSIVNELAATRAKLRAEAESAAVALALQVARRVLHREIAVDPEAILGLVKAAFEKCDARSTRRLRVSAQDAETIREHDTRLNFPAGLEITADRNLPRGSAIFETGMGDLDASIDTQLAEIDRGLTDILKRRQG